MIVAEKPELHNPLLRKQFFEELYEEAFPAVAVFVSHRNGSLQDAKDVFHDALVILYEKMVAGTFPDAASFEHYLVGIAKHVWIRKFYHEKNLVSLNELESAMSIPEDFFATPDDQKLLALLAQTGKRCLDMLRGIYYNKLSLDTVAKQFGFGSTHSASVQKFKCLEKMRDIVKEKSICYEDFLE